MTRKLTKVETRRTLKELRASRALIADEVNFVQGSEGWNRVENQTSFCVEGALMKTLDLHMGGRCGIEILNLLRKTLPFRLLAQCALLDYSQRLYIFNDRGTRKEAHVRVLALYDETIDLVRSGRAEV